MNVNLCFMKQNKCNSVSDQLSVANKMKATHKLNIKARQRQYFNCEHQHLQTVTHIVTLIFASDDTLYDT